MKKKSSYFRLVKKGFLEKQGKGGKSIVFTWKPLIREKAPCSL